MLTSKTTSLRDKTALRAACEHLRTAGVARLDAALVFGSGLGDIAAMLLPNATVVPYRDVPGMPATFVGGHRGELHVAQIAGRRVGAFLGRAHLYQGIAARDVVFQVRLAAELGATTIVLTNAAGAVDAAFTAGSLLLICDHLNLTGRTPLDFADPFTAQAEFVPMVDAYTPRLRERALQAAHDGGIALREGVYAGVHGPAYETPAEVAMLRVMGAHAVGMSTVLETIAARALGLEVAGISLITNEAGTAGGHADVLQAAQAGAEQLGRLLAGGWFL